MSTKFLTTLPSIIITTSTTTTTLFSTLSPPIINIHSETSSIIRLWATISQILWWTVLAISFASLPILGHALCSLFGKFRKSNYFLFLTTMIILDLLMLLSILFNLMSDYAFAALKGNIMCKLTAYITNVTSCYTNWLWVMMFAQRFAHIFFPMHRVKADEGGKILRILDDTRILILITGVMSAGSQLWAPFLMKEVSILDRNGTLKGHYCGPDSTLINKDLFKWIAAVESVWTYAIPFLITVLTDLAVLIFTGETSKRFTTVFTENMCNNEETSAQIGRKLSTQDNKPLIHYALMSNNASISIKIQSKDSIRACHKRRQLAIRRCLMLATMQLLLNLPNYLLQLIDEFSTLRGTSPSFMVFYLYADALFYLFYLSQYPMMAIYVQWLHSNYDYSSSGKRLQTKVQISNIPISINLKPEFRLRRQSMCFDSTSLFTNSSNNKIVRFGNSDLLEVSNNNNNNKTISPILKRHSTGSVMFRL